MGETIVFTSGKGGVGKTTTIANIGAGLSRLDKKVVMLDTDMGLRNLDVVMGLEDRINYNLLDLLDNKCRVNQALIRDKRFPNLFLIPASLKTIPLEQYEQQFKVLLTHLKSEFDYCLIDCPAGIDQGFHFAVSTADRAILLTTPHISAIKDAGRALQFLNGTKISKTELIINDYDEKLVRKRYMLSKKDIAELFDIPILGVIPRDAKIMASQNKGVPVISMHSKAGKCFFALSKQIVSENIWEGEGLTYDFS
ncbi:MAG: septum site-determining protein MinD [Lachnospiraceae bacterium]|nr:septum site-determining protein MinD [Lachnospiraceae bacterium]